MISYITAPTLPSNALIVFCEVFLIMKLKMAPLYPLLLHISPKTSAQSFEHFFTNKNAHLHHHCNNTNEKHPSLSKLAICAASKLTSMHRDPMLKNTHNEAPSKHSHKLVSHAKTDFILHSGV